MPYVQGLQLLSQYGGLAYGVALKDKYAFLTLGSRLLILDVSNPAAIKLVGKTTQWTFNAVNVAVSGNYAYVMADANNGLRVVDVSDVTKPKEVGYYKSTWGSDLAVAGTKIYVAETGCLKIIETSTPTAPYLLGSYCPPMPTTNQSGFYSAAVALHNSYAFYAVGAFGLHIVNVANPQHPQVVGTFDETGSLNDVVVSADGDFAFLADGGEYDAAQLKTVNSGLRVLDVSDPANPQEIGFSESKAIAKKVGLSASLALLASGNDYDAQQSGASETGVEVFDVSNPANPAFISIFPENGIEPFDLALNGQTAYLVDNGFGLRLINVTDPQTPKKSGEYPAVVPLDVFQNGNHAYLAAGYAGLQIMDVTTPSAPQLSGMLDTGGYTRGVIVSGNYAYLAEGDDGGGTIDPTNMGLLVVNVSNPAAPQQVDFIQTEFEPRALDLVGHYVYLVGGDNGAGIIPPAGMGLRIFDISDPANLQEVGFVMTHGNPNSVVVSEDGNYAYVADGMYGAAGTADVTGLEVISTANKAEPNSLAFLDTPGYAYDADLAGKYIYLADGPNGGLRIIDVSNPQAPLAVNTYVSGGSSFGVTFADNRAYLADGWNGLQVINVANPATPYLEAFYVSGNTGFDGGVAVSSGTAYVASGFGGFLILKYEDTSKYSIAGKVLDQDGKPVADITISAGTSYTTKTNANGEYKLENLPAGTYTVTPSAILIGVTFDPANRVGTVPPSATGVDFRLVPITNCPNLIKNGDFETDSDWYLPVTRYPAGFSSSLVQEAAAAYSADEAYSGARSLRVGIVDAAKNVYSYSSGWQQVTLPSSLTSATLRFYLYPLSVNGIDPSGDVQLMILLNNNKVEVERLVSTRSDSRAWTAYSFDVKKYAGKTIWVYFGVVNNGYAANMAMYVDNVSLEACTP